MSKALRRLSIVIRYFIGYLVWLASYCTPRFASVWVFGCRYGQYYQDNPRFLFEYVSDKIEGVHPIWITRNRKVYDFLQRQGKSVCMASSVKGIFYSLIAKVAIISASHDDLLKLTIGGAKIIHLWHATQIKTPLMRINAEKRLNFSKKFIDFLTVPMQRVDLVTVSSKNQVDLMADILNVSKSKIKITGYPKTDCLINIPEFNNIKDCFNKDVPFGKKIVLYLPTFRNRHYNQNYDLFDRYGFDCDEAENLLNKHNAILLYIPHYHINTPKDFVKRWEKYSSLYVYEKTGPLFDINLLHPYVDILITDYSSVFTNYSILNKPMVFAKFDFDYYVQSNCTLNFDYDRVTPGPKAKNWPEVLYYIEQFVNSIDGYREERILISKEFHNYHDGKNCERVFSEINRLINR